MKEEKVRKKQGNGPVAYGHSRCAAQEVVSHNTRQPETQTRICAKNKKRRERAGGKRKTPQAGSSRRKRA
jgi:hypothetical protein